MYLKHQTIKQQTVFINSFVSTNYHTKPRTNNSAEEATTGNTSVIYGIGYPQAAQTHVAREGCNVIYITYVTRAGVALQTTVENIRDFVWEIYH